jgi:hypothetical protein
MLLNTGRPEPPVRVREKNKELKEELKDYQR